MCLTLLTLWRVAQGQSIGAIIGADNTVLGVGPEGAEQGSVLFGSSQVPCITTVSYEQGGRAPASCHPSLSFFCAGYLLVPYRPVPSLGLTSPTDPILDIDSLVGLRYENAYDSLAAGQPYETWGVSVNTGTGTEVITASNPDAYGNSGIGSTVFVGSDGGTTATSSVTAQSGNFLVRARLLLVCMGTYKTTRWVHRDVIARLVRAPFVFTSPAQMTHQCRSLTRLPQVACYQTSSTSLSQ